MDDPPNDVRLTDTQLGILAALCRPIAAGNHFATPATDQQIAAEVFLSVDAVKGHLRTLCREFGIKDLPHDQKRARLVELVIEGCYLPPPEPAPATPKPRTVAEQNQAARAAAAAPTKRPIGPYVTMAILIVVVIAATLSISGIFNQGPTSLTPPTPAAFRTEVAGYCKLALSGSPTIPGKSRVDRAKGYLEVIETMRGRFQSLLQPSVPDIALERFSTGLTNAANYNSDVAQSPPAPGSQAEAKDVAELTFAAGQVQAGAVGYELGHECLAIGELVARSAENAAAP